MAAVAVPKDDFCQDCQFFTVFARNVGEIDTISADRPAKATAIMAMGVPPPRLPMKWQVTRLKNQTPDMKPKC